MEVHMRAHMGLHCIAARPQQYTTPERLIGTNVRHGSGEGRRNNGCLPRLWDNFPQKVPYSAAA